MSRYIPQGKEVFIDTDFFKKGLVVHEDPSFTQVGSFSSMNNTNITNKGGVGPRQGTELIGTEDISGNANKSIYTFKRSFNNDEILIKNVGDKTLAFSSKNTEEDWFTIKDGNTIDKEWGYVTSIVNEENKDILMGGNRFDNMVSWSGNFENLTSAVNIGDTDIEVVSTLTDEVYESGTVSSSTSTTITVTGESWTTDQWKDIFVVRMTSGTYNGEVRTITSNTVDTLTIDNIGGTTTGDTFEIRIRKFNKDDSLRVGDEEIVISKVEKDNIITLVSATTGAVDSGKVVSDAMVEHSGLPKGNRFTNWLTRIFVGRVRSGEAKDAGGTAQGYTSGGSLFVSATQDPLDFDYSVPRVAGEGDIISAPYGGGDITDVKHFENKVYLFKKDYIEAIDYTQDANDLVTREPLKVNIGSVGKVIVGSDDIYFITKDNEFTSIGRAYNKDLKPQTSNIGFEVKRLLDKYDFSDVAGIEYKGNIYISFKEKEDDLHNTKTMVYSKQDMNVISIWDKGFQGFTEWEHKLVGAEASTGDFKILNTGRSDDNIGIYSNAKVNFFNLVSTKNNQQAVNGVYTEGYVDDFSKIKFYFWKDFEKTPFLEMVFDPTKVEADNKFTNQVLNSNFQGANPLGSTPLGVISMDLDEDGKRRFYFRVYFPFVYGRYFAFGWSSEGVMDYEITRVGLSLKEQYNINTKSIKNL